MENIFSSEKILFEKRKRHQTYVAMDQFLSIGTYADFLSPDTFFLLKTAYFLARCTNNKAITLDLLFVAYFYCESNVAILSKTLHFYFEFQRSFVKFFPELLTLLKKGDVEKNFGKAVLNNSITTIGIVKDASYSQEVYHVFEKASNNALTRFKTPVITPEILFITLMEQKSTKTSKMIQKSFANENEWSFFRYEVMKLIHREESILRSQVNESQRYFGYLLKTQMETSEFEYFTKTALYDPTVFFFRNGVIRELIQGNIFESVFQEVHLSMQLTSKRTYSL
jgi:hypothetical protein